MHLFRKKLYLCQKVGEDAHARHFECTKRMNMAKKRERRNSTAEFLIFQIEGKEQGIEVYYKDENIWATQKAMVTLFDVNVPAISKHLKNIFESGELKDDAVRI